MQYALPKLSSFELLPLFKMLRHAQKRTGSGSFPVLQKFIEENYHHAFTFVEWKLLWKHFEVLSAMDSERSRDMLSGSSIVERGIIANYSKDGIRQCGIDLRARDIQLIRNSGYIPREGQTILPDCESVQLIEGVWKLLPGYYQVWFEEACRIPLDIAMILVSGNSLKRCGGEIHSEVFDPGFHTDSIGSFLTVHMPLEIEAGARLCRAVCHELDRPAVPYSDQHL